MATIDRRGIAVNGSSPSAADTPDVALAIKLAVRVASTANLTLAGLQTVDGVSLIEGNRVLAKNQTDATQNGIYVVSSGNWSRSVDFDASAEIASGVVVMASAGTVGAQTMYQLTTADPIVIDTSNLTWAVVSGEMGPQGTQGIQGIQGVQGIQGLQGVSGASALTRVRVAATANVAIATALENGDTLDGVVLATGDLVLLTGQTAPAENGVYIVSASGAAVRHNDFDAYDELPGAFFSVMEGTVKADTVWQCTSDKGGTISSTAVAISEYRRGWTNTRLAKTAAYMVVNADKGKTIALGGAAFYALTFSAASGYDADFQVVAVNEDTVRAKTMAINGLNSFFLYPGQSCVVFSQNNVWRVLRYARWKLNGGTINLYTDFTNGNDANDGLAAGSGNAKKTVQAALDSLANDFDFSTYAGVSGEFGAQTLAVINMAANTTDTQGVHFSAHAFVGAQGGAAVKILGGSGAKITKTGGDAMAFFSNTQVQVSGIELSTVTFGSCLVADLGAQVYIVGAMTFAACAGSHISVNNGGKVYRNASYTVSGNAATAHMLSQGVGGSIIGNSITVTISANITTAFWALASNMSAIIAVSETFSLGAFSVTAKRYEADNLALVSSNGGGASYFPGNSAGSTSGGGQYV
jgi:hypothetical protein